jgi:hypothetical protein
MQVWSMAYIEILFAFGQKGTLVQKFSNRQRGQLTLHPSQPQKARRKQALPTQAHKKRPAEKPAFFRP